MKFGGDEERTCSGRERNTEEGKEHVQLRTRAQQKGGAVDRKINSSILKK